MRGRLEKSQTAFREINPIKTLHTYISSLAAVLISSCGCEKHHAPHHAEHKQPEHKHTAHHGNGDSRGGTTSLDVYSDGATIHLLFAETADAKTFTVFHSRSDDGGTTWSKPVRADFGCGAPSNPHRGMDAQLAASGKNLIAVWQTAGTDKWGGGPMATALSSDGGKTWRAGGNPADDGLTAGHGFIDIAADTKGNFHLIWLDSRNGKQGLRYTRSTDAGKTWEKNQTLDDETCECCWNSLATDSNGGVFALYRDKDPRDMALAVSRDNGATWQRAGVVGKFDWKFDGCPHVGGNVVRVSGKIHAVVWTGSEGKAGIYHLTSSDGATWESPRQFPSKAHRPDIAVSADGKIAAAWDGVVDGKYGTWGTVSADGEKGSEPRRLSAPAANATHPRVVSTPHGFRVFWTEITDEANITWRSESLSNPQTK